METIKRNTVTVDAEGKNLGRLAADVAVLLRGKNKPNFQAHIDGGDFVVIKNVDKMKFSGNKLENKHYYHFTGYLGNLKDATLKEVINKKGAKEVLRRAVMGMLCKNRLRAQQIKRLKFE